MISRRQPTWRDAANPEHERVEPLPRVDVRDVTDAQGWNNAVALLPDTIDSFTHAAATGLSADYAEFNDRLLRAMLQIPFSALSTERDRENRLDKLISIARADISRTRNEKAMKQFGERTETIQSSILQLLRFIVPHHQREPNVLLSTCVSLDVDYGMDLIGARGWWVPETNELRVQLTTWQAKASRIGLTDEEVRRVHTDYREKMERIPLETDPSPDWLRRRLADRLRRPFTRAEIGAAGNRLDTALAMIRQLQTGINDPSRSPFEKFFFQDRLHRLCSLFPSASGTLAEPPNLNVLRTPIIRFLVDTESGTKNLTAKQTESWPVPPT